MEKWQKIGVIGAGAWGTAIAAKMAGKFEVKLWAFEEETAQSINQSHENKAFLPGIKLPASIQASSQFEVLSPCQALFLVAPVQHIRALSTQFKNSIDPKAAIIICSKGIETSTGLLVSDILAEILPNPLAAMSGPSFADEAARDLPTAMTLAAKQLELAREIAAQCSQDLFKLYPSNDIIGTQLGGAIKNVIAIACGIAYGAQLGQNARAMLIARGLAESAKLVEKMGGNMESLLGLSGIGDMVLTCTSTDSRNTSLGIALGKGEKLKDILAKSKSVNEGVWTAASIATLAKKYNISMPICAAVNDILTEKITTTQAIQSLLEEEVPQIEIDANE